MQALQASDLTFSLLSNTVAQVVLLPSQHVSIDLRNLIYCSGKLESKSDDDWKSEPGVYLEQRRTLGNLSDALEYLAVGVQGGGPIVAINLDSLGEEGLAVRSAALLCAFQLHTVMLYPDPAFRQVNGSGVVLLQCKSLILEKVLGDGEEVDIPYDKLIGYSAEATVVRSERNKSLWKWVKDGMNSLTVRGPGIVYFSAFQPKECKTSSFTFLDLVLLSIFLCALCRICSIFLTYVKKVLKSYDE